MSGRRFGPAVCSLVIALGLGSACATAGDGELAGVDLSEAGTGDDGTGDATAHTDSAVHHDSSSGSDSPAATDTGGGFDTSTGVDSGGFDSSLPDASVGIDSGVPDSSVGVDSGTTCAQNCSTGCCDVNNVCHTTFTDQYCPTTNMGGGACEDCASQSSICFLDIIFYVCF